MKVGVIGGGVSGLVAAYEVARGGAKVVVYEKEDYLGGHAKTVSIDGVDLDLGFMVFNRVCLPLSISILLLLFLTWFISSCTSQYRHCIFSISECSLCSEQKHI
ncbi:hypothetical protein BT93_H1968 [Corymbia citriodora subsp. variegata]|nr:hypothetical protein BT93_H1968 [Corymbia citriodora subsp. variegata]